MEKTREKNGKKTESSFVVLCYAIGKIEFTSVQLIQLSS